jgi:hypothetical protein
MPKLTDAQLVILSAAAARDGGAVLPLPKSLKSGEKAITAALERLVKAGLLAEQPADPATPTWRTGRDGRRLALVITEAGMKAIDGIESDEPAPPAKPQTRAATKAAGAAKAEPGRGKSRPAKPSAAKAKAGRGKARQGKTAKALPSAPVTETKGAGVRPGTKLALLIELLGRKGGASIAEAVEATGWQPHSVRGAISGALKKKLGLTVASETVEGRGRVYRIDPSR